jgi:hypothetical protein
VSTAVQVPTGWWPSAGTWSRRSVALVLVVGLVAGAVIYLASSLRQPEPATIDTPFPHDAAMERVTGVQFTRVAVVADGGLVMVEYVVQDVEKATAFQADREHVPTVSSQARDKATNRVSIMKPGHLIRAGQTYYLVYQNTDGALRSGEWAALAYRGQRLTDVPVL